MNKFSKNNFLMIIKEIEEMESLDQNIWVPIGILERMYDNYNDIDDYFHSKREDRNVENLYKQLNMPS
jgi:hypothetical protein